MNSQTRRTAMKSVLAVFAALILGSVLWMPDRAWSASGRELSPTPTATPVRPGAAKVTAGGTRKRYSEFPHDQKAHQVACSSCHKFPSDNWKKVRKEGEAFPDVTEYPKHASCINCHKQQFFSGRPPVICSICHTNPGPRNSTRHPFPNPREIFDNSPKGKTAQSDFTVQFPHDKHIDIVTGLVTKSSTFVTASWKVRGRAEESCAVCHKTMAPQGDSAEST